MASNVASLLVGKSDPVMQAIRRPGYTNHCLSKGKRAKENEAAKWSIGTHEIDFCHDDKWFVVL